MQRGFRAWIAPLSLSAATALFALALFAFARPAKPHATAPTPSATQVAPAASWVHDGKLVHPSFHAAGIASGEAWVPATNDTALRIDAAFRLGKSNDPGAVTPLCGCLSDDVEAEPLRIACASALAKLRRRGSVACLSKHVAHWSPGLRDHVGATLKTMKAELPKLEVDLVRRVRRLEDLAEIDAEMGDKAAFAAKRARFIALRWELHDLQSEWGDLQEIALE